MLKILFTLNPLVLLYHAIRMSREHETRRRVYTALGSHWDGVELGAGWERGYEEIHGERIVKYTKQMKGYKS